MAAAAGSNVGGDDHKRGGSTAVNGDGSAPRLGAFAGDRVAPPIERTPSTSGWQPPPRLELGASDYGLDAPVFVARCIGYAAGAALAAAIVFRSGGGRPSSAATAALLAGGSAVGAALGASSFAYSKWGKLAHRDHVVADIAWRGDERVLDIGTGGGLLLIGAAMRLTSGKAVGIDIWRQEDLTNNSRETTMRNAYFEGVTDRIEVRFESAQKLETSPRNSYDVIFAMRVLGAIPAPGRDAACREIARVLKVGGTAVVSDSRGVAALKRALVAAGLVVTSERISLLETFTYLRTIVATKPSGG